MDTEIAWMDEVHCLHWPICEPYEPEENEWADVWANPDQYEVRCQ